MRIVFKLDACSVVGCARRCFRATPPAQDYPTRNVTILVPFAPGGGTDLLARVVAQKLEQRLGKSFVIENRPGAGTVIAAGATAKAAPDGYTLMQATSGTMAMNGTIFKSLPYDAGQGSGAGLADRRRAVRAGGQCVLAGAQRRRSRQAREGKAADLRLRRRRRVSSSQRRAVQQHDRHQDDARSLQGQRAGHDRPDRRPHRRAVRRYRAVAAIDPRRQSPRARHHQRRAGRGRAGNPAAREGRRARLTTPPPGR